MRQFSHVPPLASPPALMVFESLGVLSFFPILKMFARFGVIQIHYVSASSFGLKIIRILKVLGVVKSSCLMGGYLEIDTEYATYYGTYFVAFKICHLKLKEIEQVVSVFFPGLSEYSKNLLAAGVKSAWIYNLAYLIWLQAYAERVAKELNISLDRVAVVSIYATLVNELQSGSPFPKGPVPIISQPFRNFVIQNLCWSIYKSIKNLYWSIRGSLARLFYAKRFVSKLSSKNCLPKIAFAAVFGINKDREQLGLWDDLKWWEGSGIPSNRLVYCYDRPEFQPTAEKVEFTDSMGIQSFVLDYRFSGDSSRLILDKFVQKPIWPSFLEVLKVLKWSFRAFFPGTLSQSVIAQSISHLVGAKWLATYYRALNVKGVLHHQLISADWHSLAAELSDGCRFGYARSYLPALSGITIGMQAFFCWGANDAKAYKDSGCISKYLLIAGSSIRSSQPQAETRNKYLTMVDRVRISGANYVLALFDSSFDSKEFYSFFLNWLVKDPNLGLIVKSKGGEKASPWFDVQADGLGGLVERALKTGRLQIASARASPADIATIVDFSVGIGTYSAVVMSALEGARVFFVDFERMDQGMAMQSTFLLHTLGPNRCVFYDFGSVKRAVLEFVNNPESAPDLGNASPVLDLIDPFRDGLASQRISEYIKWYMDGRDNGLNRDDALLQATEKYAAKWGEDKVVRGLPEPKEPVSRNQCKE
jgi:hypothetical protein